MVRRAVALAARIAVAAAVATAGTGCASRATCPPGGVSAGAAADTAVADVLRTIESWRQAYEARTPDALLPIYDHGNAVALVTQGVAVVGWDAVEPELTGRLARARDIHLRISDIQVAPLAGGAIATAALAREIAEGSTSVTDLGTLTLVFGRDGERFVILAEHFSIRPR